MRIPEMTLRKGALAGVIAAVLIAPQAWSQALPFGEPETERYVVEVLIFRHTNAPDDIGNPGALSAIETSGELDYPDADGSAEAYGIINDADAAPANETFGDMDEPAADTGHLVVGSAPDAVEPEPVESEPEPALIYEPVPEEAFTLAALEERMRSLGTYAPLLHVAWIQESFPADQAPAFRVGETYAGRPDLTGTIRFSHGRYPHLELDLSWRPEALAYEYPDWQGYQLHEYRRMRVGEDHYFDNAHFGAITRVMPEEPEAPEILEDASGSDQPLSAPR